MNRILINISTILSLALFLVSCGSYISISPRGCMTDAVWSKNISSKNDATTDKNIVGFTIKKRIKSYFGNIEHNDLRLKKLLEDEGIACGSIETLALDTSNDWIDSLTSIVPLLSTRTIRVSGTLNKYFHNETNVMDDDWAMEWQ